MIAIRHIADFDYLQANHVVVDEYLVREAAQVVFRSRSGLFVTVSGTRLFENGAFSLRGRANVLTISDELGTELFRIEGLSSRADHFFSFLESGMGLPRILAGADALSGSEAGDMLEGYNGNDTIQGLGGDDLIGGGDGDDVLTPGAGNDVVYAGEGRDTVILAGNRSDWTLEATADAVIAVSTLSGEVKQLHQAELLRFDSGDLAVSNVAGITLTAAEPGQLVFGTVGIDSLTGSEGDEHFDGIGAADTFTGLGGNDVYEAGREDRVVEADDGGYDHVNFRSSGIYFLPDNVESVAPRGRASYDFRGNDLDNEMFGADVADTLTGGLGDDVLHGAGGGDRLIGGDDADTLYGASGDDVVEGGAGNDLINGGGDADTVTGGDGDDVIRGDSVGAEGLAPGSDAVASRAHLEGADGPLNVLFVSIDDLAPVFSLFPNAPVVAHTPNIDAFFGQSTVFTNAHATAPLCNVSRTSVLLGVDADTSGVTSNEDAITEAAAAFQSLPSFLKDSGYLTAFTGKIFHDNGERSDPGAWTEFSSQSRAIDWKPATFHDSLSEVLDAQAPDVPDEAFADARNLDYMEEFLGRAHDDPFFFALGQFRPHAVHHVPQEYYDLYPLDSIVLPAHDPEDLVDLGQLGLSIANDFSFGIRSRDELRGLSPATDEVQIKIAVQAYLAAVSYADAVFGKAMAALQASAYANNTAVVLWSDHGFHLAEKFHFSKFTLWEQGTRAPLAFSIPGVEGGTTVDSSVSLLDVYKTVTDIIGIAPPGHVQGNSLLPLIENPALPWDHPSVSNYSGNYSVRSNDYRYIQYWDGSEELYDHGVDPSEITNIAGDPAYADIIAHLRRYIPGGDDTLSGGLGNDQIFGGAGADQLNGDDGNDNLDGGTGADAMAGGVGDDIYIVDDDGDAVTEAENEGADAVRTSLAAYTLGDHVEQLTGTSAAGQALVGNGLANTITAGSGDDSLDGGAGADTMTGGLGDDSYAVDEAGDQAVEAEDQGTDEVRTALASYTLGDHLENLTGTAPAGQALTGNGLDNAISGEAGGDIIVGAMGDDRLDGGAGGDAMAGGIGDDSYFIDDLGDSVIEVALEGTDQVHTALAAYTLHEQVENLTGTAAAGQALTGNGLANAIAGGIGYDSIDGGIGADSMTGGLGDDSYRVDDAGDAVIEAEDQGTDEVQTSLAAYTLGDHVENLSGTAVTGQELTGNGLGNRITGGAGSDTIAAGAGDDRLDGADGADAMAGGLGDDTYRVDDLGDRVEEAEDEGADAVHTALAAYTLGDHLEDLTGTAATGQALTGNALDNAVTGAAGSDIIVGAAGDDRLDGGAGADAMGGGVGNDSYFVDDEGDAVAELQDEGTDEVRTSLAVYSLGDHVEQLTGTSALGQVLIGNGIANRVEAGAGDDSLDGGGGADIMAGGAGDDVYAAVEAGDTIVELADGGIDELQTSLLAYTLIDQVENLTGTFAGGQTLVGNSLANAISGGDGDDSLEGGEGDDFLSGGAGNDYARYAGALAGVTVRLTTAASQNTGGAGVDRLVGIENVGGSVFADLIIGSVGDNRLGGGGGDDILSGLAGDDILTGGLGNDQLSGGGGADRMEGAFGDDVYFVQQVGDLVVEKANQGHDLVNSYLDHVLADNVEDLRLIGTALNGTGNTRANRLFGTSADNVLEGGEGDDALRGLSGSDRLVGGAGADIFYGGFGDDELFGDAGADRLNGEDGADRIEGGIGNDGLYGSAGADILLGGDGDDALSGGLQRDTMTGGAGRDQFIFGNGDASAESFAADLITDFSRSEGDRIYLRQMDADLTQAGDQNFSFVGTTAFSGKAGELRYDSVQGDIYVTGDTNGDGAGDFVIRLLALPTLAAIDFVL